jgi:hypothetical protein
MLLGLCVTANAAMAADLPKEGTSTGTFSAFATFKATVIGKDRILTSFDGNGPSLTNGFADHMTWHCWGRETIRTARGETKVIALAPTSPVTNSLIYSRMINTRWTRKVILGRINGQAAPANIPILAVAEGILVNPRLSKPQLPAPPFFNAP